MAYEILGSIILLDMGYLNGRLWTQDWDLSNCIDPKMSCNVEGGVWPERLLK